MAESTPVPSTKGLVQLCGLWKQKNANGSYLAGSAGNVRYYVFPNKKRKNDKQPEFQICIGQRKPKETADEFTESEEPDFGADPETGEVSE